MKNKISDLRDYLFGQMERLANEDLTPEQIKSEAGRAEAMVLVADQILESSKVQLMAARLYAEHGDKVLPHLPLIGKAEA